MNPENIPTENLYKFMAIAGLAIFIASGYTFLKTNIERLNASINQLHQWSIDDVEFRKVGEIMASDLKIDSLEYKLFQAKIEFELKKEGKPALTVLEIMLDKAKKENAKASEAKSKVFDMELRLKNAENVRDSLKIIGKTQTVYSIVSFILFISSACLAFFGFYFWYTKIQKHEDKLMIAKSK